MGKRLGIVLLLFIITVTLVVRLLAWEKGENMEDSGKLLGIISNNNIDLNSDVGTYKKGINIDQEIALEIGNLIIKHVYGENVIKKTDYLVFELEGQDVIVISRVPKGGNTVGGDYNVAISKKDASILRIWMGE
ncbi:hypothetical protein [Ruminiclostridium cellobioparum]|uniref:hypothetical protein n=1 Tax=Ruminiclostridium cellobioparum TaxID=29355 RepID=UPI0028B193A8|nr:hypothetical protein [Ruminiclostridium cellobioparum]